MIKSLINYTILSFFIAGCTTVPIIVNVPQDESSLNIRTNNSKLPLKIGIVIPSSFSNFSLKSTISHLNIDYNFQYNLGDDFNEILPKFFSKRFEDVRVIDSISKSGKFDYVFMPTISSSRLSTNISLLKVPPSYALEINLNIIIMKNRNIFHSITIKEVIEKDTEVSCWICWGEKILNQQKIKEEYYSLLSKVLIRLDSDIINGLKEKENVE